MNPALTSIAKEPAPGIWPHWLQLYMGEDLGLGINGKTCALEQILTQLWRQGCRQLIRIICIKGNMPTLTATPLLVALKTRHGFRYPNQTVTGAILYHYLTHNTCPYVSQIEEGAVFPALSCVLEDEPIHPPIASGSTTRYGFASAHFCRRTIVRTTRKYQGRHNCTPHTWFHSPPLCRCVQLRQPGSLNGGETLLRKAVCVYEFRHTWPLWWWSCPGKESFHCKVTLIVIGCAPN
jgi:hypothetical protein